MPKILVSNDDGIHAPGIYALMEVAKEFGDVTVVAPSDHQSGMGHAITIGRPLRIKQEKLPFGIEGYAVTGTPADCVKIGTGVILDDTPDLILSGINHGANASVSAMYSGTLSAAREGAIQKITSIGFSLCNLTYEADFSASQYIVRQVIQEALSRSFQPGTLLNVNIPDLPLSELKGIMITRQAEGRWIEEFEERADPYGKKYYWLTGEFHLHDTRTDTDSYALDNGYVSITPMQHDMTDAQVFETIQNWPSEING